jgi:DNA-binding MarR family transcriptional regulator
MQRFINIEKILIVMAEQELISPMRRIKKFSESVIRQIGNKDIEDIVRPWYASQILKQLLEFNQTGVTITVALISKKLKIPPSTVIRNVVRFDDNHLVNTEKKGKQFIITLTDTGKKYARILENSESIEKMEEDRNYTLALLKANQNLIKDSKAIIHVREMKIKEFEDLKNKIQKEIEHFSRGGTPESQLRLKDLQRRQLLFEQEIFDIKNFIKEKKEFVNKLEDENYLLKHKLDQYLVEKMEWP